MDSLVMEMAERDEIQAIAQAALTEELPRAYLISWAGSDGFDRSDYEPDQVCIGPFHRPEQPHPSESMKLDALHSFLPGPGDDRRQGELNRYLEEMGKLEVKVRIRYNRRFSKITRKDFRCMLLLDGCFLHTRFVQSRASRHPVDDDISVDRDIVFLLENQLPFFVLEEIHKLTTPDAATVEDCDVVVDGVLGRLEALVLRSGYSAATVPRPSDTPPHVLHLLHMYFRPTPPTNGAVGSAAPPTSMEMQHLLQRRTPGGANGNGGANGTESPEPERNPVWRAVTSYYASVVRYMKKKLGGSPCAAQDSWRWSSATHYHAAGVRFMPRKVGRDMGEARSILDVELRGSTLHVPCLKMDSNTFRMLRNMVALEQLRSRRLSMSHLTTYCFFLSQLAGTEKDVQLLVAKKIIVHVPDDAKDLAATFAGLCDGTKFDPQDPDYNYLSAQREALDKLCECGWRKSMAWLRHTKCSNYFMALAVLGTIVIFVCTIEQSVYAALSYAKGRNN